MPAVSLSHFNPSFNPCIDACVLVYVYYVQFSPSAYTSIPCAQGWWRWRDWCNLPRKFLYAVQELT